jgi:hypothetical protein
LRQPIEKANRKKGSNLQLTTVKMRSLTTPTSSWARRTSSSRSRISTRLSSPPCVVDGFSPKAVEGEREIKWRKEFLRKIGYKLRA